MNKFKFFETDQQKKIPVLRTITDFMVLISIVIAGVTAYFTYKTLEITTTPQIEIRNQNYRPGQDPNMVYAPNSKASFLVKNNFFGSLTNVAVYSEPLSVIQDKADFNNIWVCDGVSNFNPLASTSELSSSRNLPFNFSYFSGFFSSSTDQLFLQKYFNVISVVRIRVSFIRKVDEQPFNKDFYYQVFDNQTLLSFQNFPLPLPLRTQNGSTMSRKNILELLENSRADTANINCSPSYLLEQKGITSHSKVLYLW